MAHIEFIEDDNHPTFKPKKNNADDGYPCPHCHRLIKRYTRKLNSNMALAMIALYKYSKGEFVHLEKFLSKHGYQRCGDASYLVYYGFLEKRKGVRADGSERNGMYKLTGRGLLFVENKITASKKFKIMYNMFEGFEGDQITIQQALGAKFNFNELMSYE